jgi:hypothetical protein
MAACAFVVNPEFEGEMNRLFIQRQTAAFARGTWCMHLSYGVDAKVRALSGRTTG